jgi:hypothetical protein
MPLYGSRVQDEFPGDIEPLDQIIESLVQVAESIRFFDCE